MSRRLVNLVQLACRTQKVAMPTMATRVAVQYPMRSFAVRTFAAHAAGGKSEPFLNPKEVADRIIEVIKHFEKVDAGKVGPDARFKEDLDLDSLDAVEVVMAIEEEFSIEIPDSEADKIHSVPDAVAYISAHPMAK